MFNIIRKLFLIKEIVSRDGELHFQRYRLLSTRWGHVYLHKILKSDQDKHLHDHPFNFTSIILKGSYREYYVTAPHWGNVKQRVFKFLNINKHHHDDAHKIEVLNGPVWTLFFVGPRRYEWGFQTEIGFINHEKYRVLKHNGYWDSF